jgi:hypothetical protein
MPEPIQPPETEPSEPPSPGGRSRRIEDIFILLCVLSLWPMIFGWEGLLSEVGVYIALGGLIFIFIRRVRRFREASAELEDPPRDN